ncbi:hypothetical protein SDC9_182110 [bioreactor metagenome]|uniref:Uncharacterized protein n=1 Tax=bioreactor metagenome TaxID=1076179 RepID=A0A645H7Y5_9ZZZZ
MPALPGGRIDLKLHQVADDLRPVDCLHPIQVGDSPGFPIHQPTAGIVRIGEDRVYPAADQQTTKVQIEGNLHPFHPQPAEPLQAGELGL